MLAEESTESGGVVPTDSQDGAEVSQVSHRLTEVHFSVCLFFKKLVHKVITVKTLFLCIYFYYLKIKYFSPFQKKRM